LCSSSLHPPIFTRFDAKLIALAVLLGKIVTLLCQSDVDDALSTLILVENDLLVVGAALYSRGKDIGDINYSFLADDSFLHGPVDIALLRIDRLFL
jgi:hypothetical protein